jgi:hypothetical protein
VSVIITLGVITIVYQLMINTRLSRRVKRLQVRDKERLFEMQQLEQMLIKYERQTEEAETKAAKKAGYHTGRQSA